MPSSENRAIFLSDLHLLSPDVHFAALLRLLDGKVPERLYLLGDVFDFWAETGAESVRPNAEVRLFVQGIAAWMNGGTEATYLTGNHDDVVRRFEGLDFGGVKIARTAIHEAGDGRKYLLAHGDQWDWRMKARRLLSFLTGVSVRWSMTRALARRADCVKVLERFKGDALRAARAAGCDGVVCGHTHVWDSGPTYWNCGAWAGVAMPSYIRENSDGSLRLVVE